ncbi:hypothetical protein HC762_00215 [bacterium]|nr:hypothetical protein [bacterium]
MVEETPEEALADEPKAAANSQACQKQCLLDGCQVVGRAEVAVRPVQKPGVEAVEVVEAD